MLCMGGRVNRISRISTNVGKFVASVQKFTNIKMIRIKPVLYFRARNPDAYTDYLYLYRKCTLEVRIKERQNRIV